MYLSQVLNLSCRFDFSQEADVVLFNLKYSKPGSKIPGQTGSVCVFKM